MVPLAALLPPALIPELSTGFWCGDVSTDPPFTSAQAVGEGTQKWHDPVSHPTEMHLTHGQHSGVWQPQAAQAQPCAHSFLTPKTGGTHCKGPDNKLSAPHGAVLASIGPSSTSSSNDGPWAASTILYQHAPSSHLSLHAVSRNCTIRGRIIKKSKIIPCQINMFM